jgi:hypothetical protein
MASTSPSSSRNTQLWIIVLVALAVLSLLAMRRSVGRAMGMNAVTTDASSLPGLRPGDEAKIAIAITNAKPAVSFEGNVLEKQTETVYARSGKKIKILFDATTPIVMGAMSDVHEGAVVHVKAKVQSDHQLRAEQLVVLTGYVQLR